MKNGRMQAKDVPAEAVLQFLAALTRPAGWHDLQPREQFCPTVLDAMPIGTPEKVALAKMRSLMTTGLVSGCACGCRGDFELTLSGRIALEESALVRNRSELSTG